MLLFGTGGFAWFHNSITHTGTCVGPGCPGVSLAFVSNSPWTLTTFPGWAAGAGAEWAFLRNWSLRLKFLHSIQWGDDELRLQRHRDRCAVHDDYSHLGEFRRGFGAARCELRFQLAPMR